MIGITNSATGNIFSHLPLKFNNLIAWLDGSDFVNHSPLGNSITVTNTNNYNTIYSDNGGLPIFHKKQPIYVKAAASSNGIELRPFDVLPQECYIQMIWGEKLGNNNYMNLCTFGIASRAICELRIRHTSNNTALICLGTNSGSTNFEFQPFTGQEIPLNTFHHIAVVVDVAENGRAYVYFDGRLIRSIIRSYAVGTITPNRWNLLGTTCWTSDTGGYSRCTDYRLYNCCLSSKEIREIYEEGPQTHLN